MIFPEIASKEAQAKVKRLRLIMEQLELEANPLLPFVKDAVDKLIREGTFVHVVSMPYFLEDLLTSAQKDLDFQNKATA